eukprot:1742259-Rhodomonas_salina.1
MRGTGFICVSTGHGIGDAYVSTGHGTGDAYDSTGHCIGTGTWKRLTVRAWCPSSHSSSSWYQDALPQYRTSHSA